MDDGFMPITKRIAKISLSISLLGLVGASPFSLADDTTPVSYTHLTLPTNREV